MSTSFEKKQLESTQIQADGLSIDKASREPKNIPREAEYVSLDAYDEDEVEQRFLNTKPTCFLIVGKPGCGKTTLAKKLAEEWRAELVSPTDLILKNIESRSEVGKRAQEILQRGESISDALVLQMIEIKLNSPEVAHHGYVLDGFPCQNSDDTFDVQSQIEMLTSFKLQPDMIINMKIPDQDLINRRTNQKVDPYLGSIYIKEIYAPDKQKTLTKKKDSDEGEEEEEDEGDGEEGGEEEETVEPRDEFFAELPADVAERLIKRPEDNESSVSESLRFYKEAILRALEFKMSNMNQSYLVELDANVSPTVLIKQLITRLETHVINKAAKPMRLSDPLEISEEEAMNNQSEQVETEELMQNITIQRQLSSKFKWRRSKWLRYCPVALKNGQILEGRGEYAAAFLDKVYAMSSELALREFLKNPRDYLRLPLPRAPCKLSIVGLPLSGKTYLAHLLAKKYNAKVIDMKTVIEPKMKAAKDELMAKAREDALQSALDTVKSNILKLIEQEKRDQAALDEAALTTAVDEQETSNAADEANTENPTAATAAAEQEQSPKRDNPIIYNEFVTLLDDGEVTISPDHPDVQVAIKKAMEEEEKKALILPPSEYAQALDEELKKLQQERIREDHKGPLLGGWILDNYPETSEQFNALAEANLVPDLFISLNDTSENFSLLRKRWYQLNKSEIDEKIAARKRREAERRALEKRLEAESGIQEETKEADEESGEGKPAEEDVLRRADTLEKIVEEDEQNASSLALQKQQQQRLEESKAQDKITRQVKKITGNEPGQVDNNYAPSKGPEVEEFVKETKNYAEKLRLLQTSVSSNTGNEPFILDIKRREKPSDSKDEFGQLIECKSDDEFVVESQSAIESVFKYKAQEFEGAEEEEAEEEEEGDEEEEIEEEDEAEEEDEDESDIHLKVKNITFGDTSYYDPVTLKVKQILVPGNQDIKCKHREKIYRFSSEENRALFMEHPDHYLPMKNVPKTPPHRFIILGPRGSGKSVQARKLADKLDVFHIKFRQRLQEMIIGKTKKMIGPEHEDPKVDEDEEEELSEEERARRAAEQPELNDTEEAIRNYLEKDDPLTTEILDLVIGILWTQEPFKSRGFILEGYPSNESESSYLLEKGYFADCVVHLNVADDEIIRRLLPAKLDRWRELMRAKQERRRNKKESKQKELEKRMERRRYEMIADRELRRRKREADGEAEEEEEEDTEALLKEEFADELNDEEPPEDQPEEEARENMINDLRSAYEGQIAAIDVIKETFKEVLVPCYTVDGNRKERIVSYLTDKKLERFVDNREALFERCYVVKNTIAKRLLDFGYKKLSRFGRWCPVRLMNGEPFPPIYEGKSKPHTVVYRSFIYYLSSKKARDEFMKNPLRYFYQPSPLEVVPLKISIIGPPKSGKTTLSKRFCQEYGCMRLSIGEAMRMVLNRQSKTELAMKINEHLFKGRSVPDELSIQCLEVAMLDVTCQIRGFILDGFPITKNQVKCLTNRALIPVKVIELTSDSKEMMTRCLKDREIPLTKEQAIVLHDSPEILLLKLHDWKQEIGPIRTWYSSEHKNLVRLDGLKSKWLVWSQSNKVAKECIGQIQQYLTKISNGQAASIANLCVTYDEMMNRLGEYEQYCTVSLQLSGELVDCSENRTMDYVAEYQGHYYKMFSKVELDEFLANPSRFLSPQATHKLPPPNERPAKRTQIEIKETLKPIELQGYCPVTFYEGKQRYESIEKGSLDFAVEYKNKIYTMLNREMRDKFLRKPDLYAFLKLPHKLPPVKEPLNIMSLPMLGYLEQTCADILIKALHSVGTFKPKFPFISPQNSCLLHLGFYLKAYNPKASEYRRKKYKQKLQYFEEQCQLIHYLGRKTTIKHKDSSRLSNEFNAKYESFFALKENVPTMNWLA